MSDYELHRKLIGSWSWCDSRGAIWSILTLRADGTYVNTMYATDAVTRFISNVVFDDLKGTWTASEYDKKGNNRPHIALNMRDAKVPLLDWLGPLKTLVRTVSQLDNDEDILYITSITQDEIKIGSSKLVRR